ncbi:hypothetical protein OH491_16845 [Termitidicoccus mucosus]|uniref:Uncharacterized protein n=1 Tax=Termitidicoccus mucosus TaxID=1184151 RepID=A0A178IJB5_9BACT|nr:hypothetical protein AW736_11750 [Opitutaceae bacterium TSB47]
MDTGLRITDTNSANDSKGRALGFEGNDFLYVVGGIVGAIGMFLLLYGMFHASLAAAGGFTVPVFVIPTAWVMMFRRGKPDGYAEDFFDHLLNREGFCFSPDNQNPRGSRAASKRRTRHAQ